MAVLSNWEICKKRMKADRRSKAEMSEIHFKTNIQFFEF